MSVTPVSRTTGKGRAFKVRYRDHADKARSETYEVKADADRRDAEIRQAKQRREPIPKRGRGNAGETFETFAHEVWWPQHVEAKNLVTKTQERYATFLDKHLIPRIGDDPIAYIDVERVLEIRAQLTADKVPDYTAARTLKLLRQVLIFAVLSGKLSHNPADVLSGRGMLPSQSRKTDKQPMWPDQTEATRRAILVRRSPNKLRDATLVSVLAYAGLRPGEALGLKWENVGTDSLRIAQVVSGGKLKPTTKTDERRTVPKLIRALMDDLADWRKASNATAAKALIFPGEHEKCWTVTAYGNWRGRVWQDCAPEGRVPYDLRHGYSLLLAHEGVPVADAAKRMGHKPATHLKDYESFLDELREQPSEPMEAVVLKARNG